MKRQNFPCNHSIKLKDASNAYLEALSSFHKMKQAILAGPPFPTAPMEFLQDSSSYFVGFDNIRVVVHSRRGILLIKKENNLHVPGEISANTKFVPVSKGNLQNVGGFVFIYCDLINYSAGYKRNCFASSMNQKVL
ncbi:hypothetical protein CDAR_581271 [Caerostris darwini]|uniref:Uncharacterized protein n=1 Tax=Caerostris darwini TaxID=1538125 RepID=A0AAV4PI73_9ARAC|nr:hypothetical protein CDAR_581271 [Caerostris darwini]